MKAKTSEADAEYDGYSRLFEEVKRRWREPRSHPTFALFFIGSFLIFAAIGVWLELSKLVFGIGSEVGSAAALRTAIATYFPAVLGSSVLQLAISDSLRSLRALGQIVAPIFFALAYVLVFAENLLDWAAIILGIIASAAALVCWWIVNADDPALLDEPLPEVATGKANPTAPLLGDDALAEFRS